MRNFGRLHWQQGAPVEPDCSKILCVGRNYAQHAAELNNPVPEQPVIFIKPSTALCDLQQPLQLPQAEVHYELELALWIVQPLTKASPEQSLAAIGGYALALDLTLRQVQSQLKQQGYPWELAKAFDHSCPVGPLIKSLDRPLEETQIGLWIDAELRQQGQVKQMIFDPGYLLSFISQHISLLPGDLVLTGTPAGVGPLRSNQQLRMQLNQHFWNGSVA